jgi:hypothetical protein
VKSLTTRKSAGEVAEMTTREAAAHTAD